MGDQMVSLLDKYLQKLGASAQYTYTVYSKQIIIDGWLWILLGILLTAAVSVLLIFQRKFWKQFDSEYRVAVMILTFFAALIAGMSYLQGILHLFNPDYYVFTQIFSALGGK